MSPHKAPDGIEHTVILYGINAQGLRTGIVPDGAQEWDDAFVSAEMIAAMLDTLAAGRGGTGWRLMTVDEIKAFKAAGGPFG